MIVEELEPLEAEGQGDLERLHSLGRRLLDLDPGRFARVLRIVEAYVSIYENPEASEDSFAARLRRASGATGRGGVS